MLYCYISARVTGRRVFLHQTTTVPALFDDNLTSSASFPSLFQFDMIPMASQMSIYVQGKICSSKLDDLPIKVGIDVSISITNNFKTFMMGVCPAQTVKQGTTCRVMFNCLSISYDEKILFVGLPKDEDLIVSEIKFDSMP